MDPLLCFRFCNHGLVHDPREPFIFPCLIRQDYPSITIYSSANLLSILCQPDSWLHTAMLFPNVDQQCTPEWVIHGYRRPSRFICCLELVH